MRESNAALVDRARREHGIVSGDAIEKSMIVETLDTVPADEFCRGEIGEIEYLSKPTVVRGGLTIPYGTPKVGKTTFVSHLTMGMLDPARYPFLGGTEPLGGSALWLDLEQPRRVSQRRFKEAGAHPELHIYRGRAPSHEQTLATIDALGAKLLVVDSMTAWLRLESENDNAEIEKKLRPIVVELQKRDVTTIVIDHAGKAEGQTGKTLRGGSAKLAIADIAVEVKIEGAAEECRRRLCFTSREEPHSDLIVRLIDGRYVLEGTAPAIARNAHRDEILEALRLGHQRKKALAEHLGVTEKTAEAWIKPLIEAGIVRSVKSPTAGNPLVYHIIKNTEVSENLLGSSEEWGR
jgi:KaiC/GvpD/RAD55 family RecA-like ATPase